MSNKAKNEVEDVYPLSPMQQGLFFQHLLGPARHLYWNRVRARLKGELDIAVFRQAWQRTVDRHSVLRTRFIRDSKGRTFQVVNREAVLPWHFEDLSGLGEAEREARINDYDGGNPRPLDEPPLMNLALFSIGPGEHVVVWSYQHIILDGWSEKLIWDDAWTAYGDLFAGDGRQAVPATYSSYIAWLNAQESEAAGRFWAAYLDGLEPAKTPSAHEAAESDYAEFSFALPADLSRRAAQAARKHRLTLTTLLQGCWALALGAERQVQDIVVGTAINDRPADLAGAENIAGLMMASVPMRYRSDSRNAVVDWLRDSQVVANAMAGHSGLTLGQIKAAAGVSAAAALFDSLCALDADVATNPLGGQRGDIEIVDVEHSGITEFPLSLTFVPGDTIKLVFTVDTSLYDADWCTQSTELFVRALEEVCAAPVAPVADIAATLAGFAPERTGGHTPLQGVDYWRDKLAGTLPVLEFPRFGPRPPEPPEERGTTSIHIDADLADDLRRLARRNAVDLSTAILAGFAATLLRYCRQDEVVIGTLPRAGGWVALRLQPTANASFANLVEHVAAVTEEATHNAYTAFEDVVAALQIPADASRTPVFQASFAERRFAPSDNLSLIDLGCWIDDSGTSVDIEFEFASGLFDADLVGRFATHVRRYIAAAAADARQAWQRIALLNADDMATLLARQGPRPSAPLARTVLDLVSAAACDHASRTATSSADGEIRFGDLERRCAVIAGNLVANGATAGTIVGLAMSRTERLPLAMLAILRAGAAFLPLDMEQPAERIGFVLENSGAQLIVTDGTVESLAGFPGRILQIDELEAIDENSAEAPPLSSDPGLAYVMYTSGSTGTPKGVAVGHRELVNLLTAFQQPLAIDADDVWAAITTTSFDISVMELLLPLTVGARVHVVDESAVIDGRKLSAELAACGATIMQGTPASWRLLFDSGWPGDAALTVLCGGEPLPLDLAQRLGASCGPVWNVYGPTETTIWSTMAQIDPGAELVSIGRPIQNTSIYIVDEFDALAPDGVEGEILIAGDGVAQGYLHNPELTESRFGIDPFNGEQRVYRTGDIGRWLPDGELEHRGRSDSQLKLRGFRIEAGDVEQNLATAEGVSRVAVTVRPGPGGDPRLVAFVVLEAGAHLDAVALRRHLRSRVPEYMIPQHFVELGELPLTHNRKIDYANLPQLDGQGASPKQRALPGTASEKLLADVWSELIGASGISTSDRFFDIGGHSMLTIRAIAMVLRETGVELQPQFFIHENLASIARRIDAGRDDAPAASAESAAGKAARRLLGKLFRSAS